MSDPAINLPACLAKALLMNVLRDYRFSSALVMVCRLSARNLSTASVGVLIAILVG
jgi:hypothetical protein